MYLCKVLKNVGKNIVNLQALALNSSSKIFGTILFLAFPTPPQAKF
jgi:hypothetical protein